VEVVHDLAFFQALRTEAKRFIPTCDLGTYRACMANCDVAFLPLSDTPFNRCKSDLKALEAAAHGLAILGSPTVYAHTIHHGSTGLLFRSEAELTAALKGWRDDPLAMQAMGGRARQMVARSRMLHQQVAARELWYRSLWERRQALTEQIYARLPDLKS
jgi:glycosyltransferase involved in cell wall biosynthesis